MKLFDCQFCSDRGFWPLERLSKLYCFLWLPVALSVLYQTPKPRRAALFGLNKNVWNKETMRTWWAHQQTCGFYAVSSFTYMFKREHKWMSDEQFEINSSFTKPTITIWQQSNKQTKQQQKGENEETKINRKQSKQIWVKPMSGRQSYFSLPWPLKEWSQVILWWLSSSECLSLCWSRYTMFECVALAM